MHPHSLTFFMNAVSQILGHRILEKHSSFVSTDFVPQKFGTQNKESNSLECGTP